MSTARTATARTATRLPGDHVGQTGPRLLAALVEVGPVWLLIGLALLFGLVLDGPPAATVVCLVSALGWSGLVWAQRATRAAGPGMRLDSLQIVGLSDGRPIGWGRVLLRWLVFTGLSVTVVGLVALVVAIARHPNRQGWHDLAAGAVVINERPLAAPRAQGLVAREIDAPTAQMATSALLDRGHYSADRVEPMVSPVLSPDPQPSSPAEGRLRPADLEWWLRLDDGRDVGVAGLVLLGRNPQPRVGEEDATLIKVVDRGRTVSKSHLAVGVDADGLFVMDRGSTNGTILTPPHGSQQPCPPGELVGVPAGTIVSFGEHWLEVRKGDE